IDADSRECSNLDHSRSRGTLAPLQGGLQHGPGVRPLPSGRTRSGPRKPSVEVCTRRVFSRCGAIGRQARRGRPPSRRFQSRTARVVLFLTLVLAVPVILFANPIDPTWKPGWYDDADADQLVLQTLSPESMVGLAVLVLFILSGRARLLSGPAHRQSTQASREPVPR